MAGKPKLTDEQVKKYKEIIVEGLYNGKSLNEILNTTKNTPSRPTVYTWLNSASSFYDPEFLNNYMRAREDSADLDVDKIEDLNQELRNGEIDAQTARVIADNLKWTAGRKKPKKYGDKLDVDANISINQFEVGFDSEED